MFALYIAVSIIVLLLMVVIHEFGHYVAGKILKFKINEFAVGFGPKIISKVNKKTGERFSLRAIPLGGYCAFEGEDELEDQRNKQKQEKEQSSETDQAGVSDKNQLSAEAIAYRETLTNFDQQAPWKRIIVLVSGALFNFVSAIIFSFLFLCIVGVQRPVVSEVYTNQAGVPYNMEIMTGDVILGVNGNEITPIKSYTDLASEISGNSYTLTVKRNGEVIKVDVVKQQILHPDGDYFGIGIVTANQYGKIGFFDSVKYCVPYTFDLAWSVLGAFGQMIVGQIPLDQMSGPVSTIGFMAEATKLDWRNMFILLPLIASNLAVFNLLPIPALDGSKVVFTVIEWIRKKPINRNVESYIHLVGFALLLIFVIAVELMKVIA